MEYEGKLKALVYKMAKHFEKESSQLETRLQEIENAKALVEARLDVARKAPSGAIASSHSRLPKDDAERQCTLASSVEHGDRYRPCCRNCWHTVIMTPAEVSVWAEVPMDTNHRARLTSRLLDRISSGLLHLHNRAVKSYRARGTALEP